MHISTIIIIEMKICTLFFFKYSHTHTITHVCIYYENLQYYNSKSISLIIIILQTIIIPIFVVVERFHLSKYINALIFLTKKQKQKNIEKIKDLLLFSLLYFLKLNNLSIDKYLKIIFIILLQG
jgi:hypothetical protein